MTVRYTGAREWFSRLRSRALRYNGNHSFVLAAAPRQLIDVTSRRVGRVRLPFEGGNP